MYNIRKGESEGYTVKSKEEDFTISHYPLEQSEFFYEQKQGKSSSILQIISEITRLYADKLWCSYYLSLLERPR